MCTFRISHTKRRRIRAIPRSSLTEGSSLSLSLSVSLSLSLSFSLDHRAQIYRRTSRPITTAPPPLALARRVYMYRARACVCDWPTRFYVYSHLHALCKSARWPFANVDTVSRGLPRDPAGNPCRAFSTLPRESSRVSHFDRRDSRSVRRSIDHTGKLGKSYASWPAN